MPSILKFVLNAKQKNVAITFKDTSSTPRNNIPLSYEYLRIFSPVEQLKANSSKGSTSNSSDSIPQVFHKKNVNILAIEPLGKHGHRIVFDDSFSDIYSTDDLIVLSQNIDSYWLQYLSSLSSTNNREESINFKAVT